MLVAGFGRVGWTVCKLLERNDVPYVALDFDMERVRRGRNENMPIYFGDASRLEVLRAAGLERARAAVITLDQPGLAERAVGALRGHDSAFTIVSRARDGQHRKRLELAGASAVVSEAVEASLQLGATVLRLSGTDEARVDESLQAFRHNDYALLDELLEEREQANGDTGKPIETGSWFARHMAPRRRRRSERGSGEGDGVG
ncbi:MAG: NAD(P)-binding protein [Rhodovibrio sp.]|nr:NAD(P)-binding protein [Rhodovibrio sp.]